MFVGSAAPSGGPRGRPRARSPDPGRRAADHRHHAHAAATSSSRSPSPPARRWSSRSRRGDAAARRERADAPSPRRTARRVTRQTRRRSRPGSGAKDQPSAAPAVAAGARAEQRRRRRQRGHRRRRPRADRARRTARPHHAHPARPASAGPSGRPRDPSRWSASSNAPTSSSGDLDDTCRAPCAGAIPSATRGGANGRRPQRPGEHAMVDSEGRAMRPVRRRRVSRLRAARPTQRGRGRWREIVRRFAPYVHAVCGANESARGRRRACLRGCLHARVDRDRPPGGRRRAPRSFHQLTEQSRRLARRQPLPPRRWDAEPGPHRSTRPPAAFPPRSATCCSAE